MANFTVHNTPACLCEEAVSCVWGRMAETGEMYVINS